VGVIDIFERWERGWWLQHAALSLFLFCTRATPPDGITALPPRAYALRFEEFVLSEVLRVPRGQRNALLPTWGHLWHGGPGRDEPFSV